MCMQKNTHETKEYGLFVYNKLRVVPMSNRFSWRRPKRIELGPTHNARSTRTYLPEPESPRDLRDREVSSPFGGGWMTLLFRGRMHYYLLTIRRSRPRFRCTADVLVGTSVLYIFECRHDDNKTGPDGRTTILGKDSQVSRPCRRGCDESFDSISQSCQKQARPLESI